MHIGYVTYGLDRSPTGIGRYAVHLVDALARLPNAPRITLLTTERSDPAHLWDRFARQPLPVCRLLPALATLGNVAVSAAAARYKFDLIHDPNGISPFLSPHFGTRRIVTIHDAIPFVMPEPQNGFDNWRFRTLLPLAVRHADRVLTDSASSRADLLRYLPLSDDKVRAIPCGVEERFCPIRDSAERAGILARYAITEPYILYVGSLGQRKNLLRLVEGFAQIQTRHPAIRLVLGGKGLQQNAPLQQLLDRLGLGNAIRFTGYLDDADLPAIYSAAKLFVFPSLYEGFGMPPLEAMACGTPTLTANTSSLPEVVGDAALTFDPTDSEALADALDRALTDDQLRAALRERGLQRAAQFTWCETARQTLAQYEELLAGKR
jgi:glycosyltransferase involved in cell wall biosynthesis